MRAAVLFFALVGVLAAQDADALATSGHYLRLKAAMDPLVRANPSDARAVYWLSQAEGALGNLDTALKLAEQAIALEPKNAAYHAQLAAACGRIAQSAGLLKQLQFGKRAKKELDTAIELDPNQEGALYGLGLFYYAAPALLGGDKQKALAAMDLLTKLNPVRGYLGQAKLAHERKDVAAEEDFLKKAVAADANSYEAKVRLGNFYLTRDLSAAWNLANEALTLDPGQAEAWKVLAQVYVATQCWGELRLLLEQARKAVPDDLAPYYYSAVALQKSGHFTGWAREFFDLYLSAPPEGEEPAIEEVKRVRAALP